MSEPEKLLKHLDLERLTAEEALREIRTIADKTMPHMSQAYYTQRLAAISILADIAAKRLPGSLH